MPLPDERPRQSVANLIGRFETQTKRHPATGASSPRSSSVVSHITGDSAKEELKEKREWPPKPAVEAANVPSEPPTSFRFKSPVIQPIQPEKPAQPAQPEPEPVKAESPPVPPETTATTNGTSEPKEVPEIPPVPASPKPEPETKGTPVSAKPPPTSKARTTPKPAQAPRASPSATQKVAARTVPTRSKTPAQTPSSPPRSQPRKPQQTGQPAPAVKKLPPKSPLSPTARPKTPIRATIPSSKSSNLYAPTAASLARARGDPSPAPTPAKKVSSSALERLSKPTAASLSRARPPTTSPAAKPATAPRTSNAPRPSVGTPASTKGGKIPATPSKARQPKATSSPEKPGEETGQSAAIISDPVSTASEGVEEDVFSSESAKTPLEEPVSLPREPEPEVQLVAENQLADDSNPIEVVESADEVVEPEDEKPAIKEEIASPHLELDQGRHPKREETASEATLTAEEPDLGETPEHTVDPITDKLAALASKHDDTDIEQIVNLLETAPSTRPISIATPPSDLQEIPDED